VIYFKAIINPMMKGFIYGALDTYTLSISDINAESWAINKFVVNALIGE
jgi:hypothetical protein